MTEDKKNLQNQKVAGKPEEKSMASKESKLSKAGQEAKGNQPAKENSQAKGEQQDKSPQQAQGDKEKQSAQGDKQVQANPEKPEQKENSQKASEAPKTGQKELSDSKQKASQNLTDKTTAEKKTADKAPADKPATAGKSAETPTSGKAISEQKPADKAATEKKASDKSSQKVAPAGKSAKTVSADKPTSEQKTTEKASADKASPETKKAPPKKNTVKLEGLFAFKMSMTTFYNEEGKSIPVTALKYEPCFVSQLKTEKKDSYSAIQMAFIPQKNKRCSKALIQHLKPAGFKEAARFVKEIRQKIPEALKVGQEVDIESFKKGDLLKISSVSKGRGFTGVMKRWNFAGGKASHGSKTHRRTGSIGQHTEPARVFPGRKMPGRHGFKKVSLSKVPVVEVFPNEGIIFIKGPVPGARNTLVSLQKMN